MRFWKTILAKTADLLENTLGEMAEWVRLSTAIDRSAEMQEQLELRGLVT